MRATIREANIGSRYSWLNAERPPSNGKTISRESLNFASVDVEPAKSSVSSSGAARSWAASSHDEGGRAVTSIERLYSIASYFGIDARFPQLQRQRWTTANDRPECRLLIAAQGGTSVDDGRWLGSTWGQAQLKAIN